ncbi:acylphosphatase [Candidatus Micrarchaeota archaeon]|nr:acylphosphatase [Candidatus Micrarchaeota archaeon]
MQLYIRVSGVVQGVFFRASARDVAKHLALAGYVKNMPDGSVEVVAHGPRHKLDKLLEWCKKGPPGARVEKTEFEFSEEKEEIRDFQILY